MPAIVYTFDPLPKVFFNAAQALFSLRDRLHALYSFGVDHVHVARFDAEYAARPLSLFLDELASLGVEEVHVGDDFRFGSGRGGNAALLRERFRVVEHSGVLCARGERISSSRLRAMYSGKDFTGMTPLLGAEEIAVLADEASFI